MFVDSVILPPRALTTLRIGVIGVNDAQNLKLASGFGIVAPLSSAMAMHPPPISRRLNSLSAIGLGRIWRLCEKMHESPFARFALAIRLGDILRD